MNPQIKAAILCRHNENVLDGYVSPMGSFPLKNENFTKIRTPNWYFFYSNIFEVSYVAINKHVVPHILNHCFILLSGYFRWQLRLYNLIFVLFYLLSFGIAGKLCIFFSVWAIVKSLLFPYNFDSQQNCKEIKDYWQNVILNKQN